jgi:hypothetical protein
MLGDFLVARLLCRGCDCQSQRAGRLKESEPGRKVQADKMIWGGLPRIAHASASYNKDVKLYSGDYLSVPA